MNYDDVKNRISEVYHRIVDMIKTYPLATIIIVPFIVGFILGKVF